MADNTDDAKRGRERYKLTARIEELRNQKERLDQRIRGLEGKRAALGRSGDETGPRPAPERLLELVEDLSIADDDGDSGVEKNVLMAAAVDGGMSLRKVTETLEALERRGEVYQADGEVRLA